MAVPVRLIAVIVVVAVVLAALFVFLLPALQGGQCASGLCIAGTFVVTDSSGGQSVYGYGAPAGQFISMNGQQIASISMYESFKGDSSNYSKYDMGSGAVLAIYVAKGYQKPGTTGMIYTTYTNAVKSVTGSAGVKGFTVGTWYDLGSAVSGTMSAAFPASTAVSVTVTAADLINFINAQGGTDGSYRVAAYAALGITAEGPGVNPSTHFAATNYYIDFTLSTGTISLSVTGG